MFSLFLPKPHWPDSSRVCRPATSSPPPDDPIGEKEIVIGELTDTEKAIWSATSSLADKAKVIADSNNQMVDEAFSKGEKVDELQVFINKAEVEATVAICKGLSNLLWYTVKKRLGSATMKGGGIAVKSGYQIVSLPSDMNDAS